MLFTGKALFSIFNEIPKTIIVEQPKGWMEKLFRKPQRQSFLYFLVAHLMFSSNSSLFTCKTVIFQTINFLFQRMERDLKRVGWLFMLFYCEIEWYITAYEKRNESSISRSQVQLLNYNMKTHFFPPYASYVNPVIPVQNFAAHYAEAYFKKLQAYQQQINEFTWSLSGQDQISPTAYAKIFRKLIYENRLSLESPEVIKFCKYYTAHKRYLNMLSWSDMIDYKIKWGFDNNVKEIEQMVRVQ